MLSKEKKKELIDKFKKSEKDTGSAITQIALLTESIKQIGEHLAGSKKDYSSKHGFMKLIGRRRRLLNYVKKTSLSEYNNLVKELGI
jgi:small subunit ribosomal protein S15